MHRTTLLTPLATLALLTLLPTLAAAESFDDGWQPEGMRAYSKQYQGMFTELGARYGLASADAFQGDSFAAHARFAFPMSVGDFKLAYSLDRLDATSPGMTTSVQRHALNLALAVHPLYIFMLGSDWLSYAIGGIYIDVGAGPQLSRVPSESDLGFHWHYGAGIDIPLFNPDRLGHAPWLNISYRRLRADIDLPQSSIDLHTHILALGLAWRFNRLPF